MKIREGWRSTIRKIKVYRIGDVVVDAEHRRVSKSGDEIDLTGKEFDLLLFLVAGTWENPGHTGRRFTKDEVAEAGWKPEFDRGIDVSGRLKKHISEIRGKLGDTPLIEVTRDGYMLLGTVEDATPPEEPLLVLHRLYISCGLATTITVCVDTLTRACLAGFHLTLTQTPNLGFVLGWFQGVIGSLVWSVTISGALLYLWFVVNDFDPWRMRFPFLASSLVGAVAGALAGFFNSYALLHAQMATTLHYAGWLPSDTSPLSDAFTVTGMGYSMPFFGASIGFGCAFTTLWIVSRPEWGEFLDRHAKLVDVPRTTGVIAGVFRTTVYWGTVFILPLMLASGVLFRSLLKNWPSLYPTLGESFCIAVGGIALVFGMLLALYSMTKGVDVVGESKCSLKPEGQ